MMKAEIEKQDVTAEYQKRIGQLENEQVLIWRKMSGSRRLELAFQAYQFALDAVRLTEKRRHPNFTDVELAWQVTRRMQGNSKLGKDIWNPSVTTN